MKIRGKHWIRIWPIANRAGVIAGGCATVFSRCRNATPTPDFGRTTACGRTCWTSFPRVRDAARRSSMAGMPRWPSAPRACCWLRYGSRNHSSVNRRRTARRQFPAETLPNREHFRRQTLPSWENPNCTPPVSLPNDAHGFPGLQPTRNTYAGIGARQNGLTKWIVY